MAFLIPNPRCCRGYRTYMCLCPALLGLIGLIFLPSSFKLNITNLPYSYSLYMDDTVRQAYVGEELPSQNMSARFHQRRRRMMEVCGQSHVTFTSHNSPRFVFPTLTSPTVLYCPAPRAASLYLRKLIGAVNNVSRPVTWKDRFHVRQVTEGYDNAVMFLFVREPFSRLLSSYVSHLWIPNLYYWHELGSAILAQVRKEATVTDIACGFDVTFPEMIRFIIENVEMGNRLNDLFLPEYDKCEVCRYHYDYIGHMETFQQDAAYIMSAANITIPQHFEELEEDDQTTVDIFVYHIIWTLSTDKERCISKSKMFLRVWRALQVQGLISFDMLYPIPRQEGQLMKCKEFKKALMKAISESNRTFIDRARALDQSGGLSERSLLKRSRTAQRKMALASAWHRVPMEDREKLRQLFYTEFKLFGYDPFIKDVFSPDVDLDIFDLIYI